MFLLPTLAVLLVTFMSGMLATLLRLTGDRSNSANSELILIQNVSPIRCVYLLIKYIIHSTVWILMNTIHQILHQFLPECIIFGWEELNFLSGRGQLTFCLSCAFWKVSRSLKWPLFVNASSPDKATSSSELSVFDFRRLRSRGEFKKCILLEIKIIIIILIVRFVDHIPPY